MIKYIIIKYIPDGYGGNLSETKTVRKSELNKYLNDGWKIFEKIIPVLTPIIKWWNKFTTNQKIFIWSIIVPCFAVFGWISDIYLDNKYFQLKTQCDELNEKYNQNIQTLILTSDSLKIEREKIESIIKKTKSKTFFEGNQIDEKKIKP